MINKHLASLAFELDSPFTNSCLFTLDRLLCYCCYAETSSSAVLKRHSKVYGKPIAPSLYSILLGLNISVFIIPHATPDQHGIVYKPNS